MILLHRRGGGIVTGEILRIAAAAFGGGRHCYGHTDHSRIVVGQRNGNQAGSPQQRKDKRQQNRQYPPHNAEERFHTFFSFFFGLAEFCFFIIAFFTEKTQKIHKLSVSLHNLSIPSEYVNFYWSFCQFSVLPVCAICAIKKTPELSPEFFHSSFFCGSSTRRVNHSFSQCRVTVPPWVSAAARTLFRS